MTKMHRVTRSRGGAAVGAGLPRQEPRGTSSGNFHEVEDELAAVEPADRQLPMELEQDTISVLPLNMLDGEIVTLRASFTTNRKAIDEAKDEILEQVDEIKQAKERNAPESVIMRYT